jgi:hypothetical protein
MRQTSPLPFPFAWPACGLGRYRPISEPYAAYGTFSYETLPPLPASDPTFAYLTADKAAPEPAPPFAKYPPELRRQAEDILRRQREQVPVRLQTLAHQATLKGLTLPESFVRFMGSDILQSRIRQYCTYFSLQPRLLACPGWSEASLIAFLHDQQGCLSWCLCLTPERGEWVLALPAEAVDTLPAADVDAFYGVLEDGAREHPEVRMFAPGTTPTIDGICLCADSFASFIYRFWVEGEIAMKLSGRDTTPMTKLERQYLEHYERQQQSGAEG